ncbi:MAG: hypothetical protein HY834_04980 [Devosia nanyangense]|uniref:Uncharacterized protein n=1 Tax=Devosia nanyangense TaxID=1228055 RepID=A0A933NXJ6_9HYPH|nr:hypothetical protein [Devosia nanyangense]
MDGAGARNEALRLWRNLPLQERLTRQQASAFAAMIAPTLDFGLPDKRAKTIEGWLLKDIARTEAAVLDTAVDATGQLHLVVPPWPQREGASVFALVISLLVMIARRPDIIANAMLWAEDGAVWFADAYNSAWWATLLRAHGGYLQLFPRVVFDVATLLPLQLTPLFGVWVALLVRAAIPAFLFSSRFSWIDWRAKVGITAYYLLMPNLVEVHANIGNTHWYLGLYVLAVILADPPRTLAWKAHDWAVLLVAGTSGPLVVFALPLLALRAFAQRHTAAARPAFLGAALALAVLQLGLLGSGAGAWRVARLDLLGFLQALSARVMLGFLTPVRWTSALALPVVAYPIAAIGGAIWIAVLIRGDWRARGLALVAPMVLAAAVYGPIFGFVRMQFSILVGTETPGYFVVTSMAWAGTLVFFLARFPRLSSLAQAALVTIFGFLLLLGFTLPPVMGPPFGPVADRIAAAPPGQVITVPIAPPGWEMTLIRR